MITNRFIITNKVNCTQKDTDKNNIFIITNIPVKIAEIDMNFKKNHHFKNSKNLVEIAGTICITNPSFDECSIKIYIYRINYNDKQSSIIFDLERTLIPGENFNNIPSKNNINFHVRDDCINVSENNNYAYSLYVQLISNSTNYTDPYISNTINFCGTSYIQLF